MEETPASRTTPVPVEFERLRGILDRVVAKVCPSWLAAHREDLVQEACLRILKKWGESEEKGPLASSYLWKVAHSAVLDEIRRRRRSREVAWDDAGAGSAAAPEGEEMRGDLRAAIACGLRSLEESRRHAVQLYLHGFTLEESARILGWNTKRVDNRRYLGLRQLRKYLANRGFVL